MKRKFMVEICFEIEDDLEEKEVGLEELHRTLLRLEEKVLNCRLVNAFGEPITHELIIEDISPLK